MANILDREVWAFDCEWVPSIEAGRSVYGLPSDCPDDEVLRTMYEAQGATLENPRPFLRTAYCRIASIAMVIRKKRMPGASESQLQLFALPNAFDDENCREATILKRFSKGLALHSPILVGYNSRASDLRILLQRSLINGISAPELFSRVNGKPWECEDIDLMEKICGMGRSYSVSLNDISRMCSIPGKLDMCGDDVCGAWYRGERESIVQYNCFDALTTYLLWLRVCKIQGLLDDANYALEQQAVKRLLENEIGNGKTYLQTFLDAWNPSFE